MIILDTNVVSEPARPKPSEQVRRWFEAQPRGELYITAITEAEILYGLAIMPQGRRRQALERETLQMFAAEFQDRVLPFDSAAAAQFAIIVADRRKAGAPIDVLDAQIAAIARARGAKVATRDIKDFQSCGVELINPWAA